VSHLPSVRSSTSVPDRAWTLVSGSVVLVRRARERGAASLGLVGEAPDGGGGPRRYLRSSRDPFWAKASAGLRRRRPGGRQAAWTCRGACRLPCRRLRRRRSGWRHRKSRSSSRPASADVPGVVPSGCRGRLAARGSVRRGESARGAAERRPGLGSVCFLFADASWWRCGLWGRREPGRRGRQQSSPHGARRSSGVRGWTGRDGQGGRGWTVFEIPSTPGVLERRRIKHARLKSAVDCGQRRGHPCHRRARRGRGSAAQRRGLRRCR